MGKLKIENFTECQFLFLLVVIVFIMYLINRLLVEQYAKLK